MPVKELVGGFRMWLMSLFRLLVIPLITWGVFHLFISDPLLLGVVVVSSGMPVATNGTILCYQYGGSTRTMAQGTFMTTVLSLASIPLGVVVVISGMPVATNGTILCYQYGGSTRTMAQGTFMTTVLSLASIPVALAGVHPGDRRGAERARVTSVLATARRTPGTAETAGLLLPRGKRSSAVDSAQTKTAREAKPTSFITGREVQLEADKENRSSRARAAVREAMPSSSELTRARRSAIEASPTCRRAPQA